MKRWKKNLVPSITKNMLIMLASCVIFFGLIFCYKIFGNVMMNRYFNNMPSPKATITTAKVQQSTWTLTLESVGSLQATNSVNVTTEAPGVVEQLKFKSGDRIKQGAILLTLNASTERAKLAAAQAVQQLAQQNLTRAQRIIKAGSISKAEFDLKKSEAEQAAAQVVLQKAILAQKTVRAPFSGQLGIRKVAIGEYLSPGRAIVSLQELDPIYVNFAVPEQELSSLSLGLAVEIKVSALKKLNWTGSITAIEPAADPETRNFNVQATFKNPDLQLRPGMFAEVTIKLPQQEQVVVIPRSAVSFNPYGNSVYVVQPVTLANDNSTVAKTMPAEYLVKRRFVKLGRNQGDLVVVTEGLVADETVATSGLLKLRNDVNVAIDNSVTPTGVSENNEIH